MNSTYTIKNFRVFDENGVSFPIKPITILTGCNSSGKSSVVKSMVLFDTYLEKIQEDFKSNNKIDLKKHMLDFTSKENATLGNFTRVLHRGSTSSQMEFSYTVHSLLLGCDVKVTFTFGADDKDDLDNGFIRGLFIENMNGETLYRSYTGEKSEGNFNTVLNNFYRFIYGQYLVVTARDYQAQKAIGNMTEKELEDYHMVYNDFKTQYSEEFGKDSIKDIVAWVNSHQIIAADLTEDFSQSFVKKHTSGNPEIIDVSRENGTLFYMPILHELFPTDRETVKEKIRQITNKANLSKKYISVLDGVVNDFCDSNYQTFEDYYRQKENEFLCYTFNWGKRSPRLFSSRYWHVRQDNLLEASSDFAIFDEGGNVFANMPEEHVVDFNVVYEALVNLDWALNKESKFYTSTEIEIGYVTFKHKMFEMFKDYISQVLLEVVTTAMPQNLSYVSTSLVSVKRLYSLESSDSFSALLKNYFVAKRNFLNNRSEKNTFVPGLFIDKWIQKFGIGHSVKMSIDEEGTGVKIHLFENSEDNKGILLSELGYGITQLFVILLRIETAILESKTYISPKNNRYMGAPLTLSDSDLVVNHFPSTIAIEEPEVHQHPKFQSMLADLFVDAYKEYNVQFIIETHSEYLIRKLQTLVGEKSIDNSMVSLVYVYDSDPVKRPMYTPQVKTIDILPDGRLSDKFGEGFFDEADRLAMNLLTIKVAGNEEA